MRSFLTFVAVALVTALTVALVAPPFIDWSARRGMVARAIAERIGTPVRISGPVTLRLLPTPFLQVADVAFGPARAPWLQGRTMRIDFGLSSLFGDRIALDDVEFDHPSLSLGPHFSAPAEGRREYGHIGASHAEIRVERAGASPILLHDVNFEGSARSGRGPWRGGGDFAYAGARANYQLAADAFTDDALPLRAEIDAAAARADFDGRLILADAPSFVGTATLAGAATTPGGDTWPWRIAGGIAASGDTATISESEVRLGQEPQALEAEGQVTLRFGARLGLDADLKAKTLDVDALLRTEKQTFVSPARAVDVFSALAAETLGRDAPLAHVSLKLQGRVAYLGARMLAAPKLALSGAPDAPMRLKFDSGLPGGGHVAFDGALELGSAPILRGRGQGAVGDFSGLAAWLAEGEPALAARLTALQAALPEGAISASGDIELSPEGYAVRGLNLGVAASRFNGGIVYRLPMEKQRGRLFLDLASDALDIAAAPNVEAGLDWLGDTDLDFRLQADTLRVARVGLTSVSGGSLVVRATRQGDVFKLAQLSLDNLGGASISAQGETSPSGRWTRVKLDAGRLGDFAALVARAAPGPFTRWLLQRADALGPAKATFEARREGPPLATPLGLDFLKSTGTVAGAKFGLTLSRAPAPVDAIATEASLDSPDAGGLLRKLGFKLAPGPAASGQLTVRGSGQWDRGFDGEARLALAGSELDWQGAFRPQDAIAWLDGPMKLKSADLAPALAALGLAGAAAAPADLAADVEAAPDGVRLQKLAGTLAGAHVSGELSFPSALPSLSVESLVAPATAAEPAPATVTGALSLDHASLGGLLSLALGRPAPGRGVWTDAKFGPPLLSPTSLDIGLNIDALDLGIGVGRAMTSRLLMDSNRFALADAALLLNGGKLSGRLELRRGKTQATAAGALALQGVLVERAGFGGRLDANLDFAGAGDSPATLIAGLAGAGRLSVTDGKIPRLDPQALARAYVAIEKTEGAPPDAGKLESQLAAELDKAPLTFGKAGGALALSSGALRFGPLDPAEPGGVSVSGAFDLARLSLSLDLTETYARLGRFWSGPPPTVEINENAAPEATTRRIDAAMLAAGLAAEAIARESDRIANFEADVRERAMFNRRRKAEQFLERRQAEISAYFDDRERRRLMDLYLGPYSAWAASHGEPAAPPPRSESRAVGKDATGL